MGEDAWSSLGEDTWPIIGRRSTQRPFAKDYLVGMSALSGHKDCGVTLTPPAYYSGAAAMGIGLGNI